MGDSKFCTNCGAKTQPEDVFCESCGQKLEADDYENKPEVKEEFISKIDFLKDFKKFDPDDEKGKEKDTENIKVSLTSKN